MRMLFLITALAATLAATPALAGDENGETETFGCATAKLQNGQGEGYNLNWVIFGPPPKMDENWELSLGSKKEGPSAEVCGYIIADGDDTPFGQPTRVIASDCQTVTPDDPFQLNAPFLADVDEAFGRLRITQTVMNHEGPICKVEPCEKVMDEKKDGRMGPPPRARGVGSLNVNTLFPNLNSGTVASNPVECHPLPDFDSKRGGL